VKLKQCSIVETIPQQNPIVLNMYEKADLQHKFPPRKLVQLIPPHNVGKRVTSWVCSPPNPTKAVSFAIIPLGAGLW